MASGSFRFDRFLLDPADRRLLRDGEPVELNARYLDALLLLVREQGRLVSKDRFLDEVWGGIPVTDEALTQCVKMLRQRLGDDVANPRFIETVPKHGYRFVASVEGGATRNGAASERLSWRELSLLAVGGTVGGGLAGLLGGLFYGFAGASQPDQAGVGAISVLLVVLSVTVVIALIGAAGVSFGMALSVLLSRRFGPWLIGGGAVGGLIVAAIVKLLGLDGFRLLIGHSPGDITGPLEGFILGGFVGGAAWLVASLGDISLRRSIAIAAAPGAIAGLLIGALGGHLMGGSLELLARSFPDSRLRLDQLGRIFGEPGFGPVTTMVTSVLEAALFAACVVGGVVVARRSASSTRWLPVTDSPRTPSAAAGTSRA
jgi:DNA-binding winged helix-turn-helix (wHTH) protein